MRMIRTARRLSIGFKISAAMALVACLVLASTAAHAIQIPTFSFGHCDCVTVAGLDWYTDYDVACETARNQRKMLLVNFVPCSGSTDQRALETYLHEHEEIRAKLDDYVLVRVFDDERVRGLRNGLLRRSRNRVIDDATFDHLGHTAGLAIVDFKHTEASYYGDMVTALPFKNGKYYRWTNSHLQVALDLPTGTISQRTMVWAVRIHPESPQSTEGTMHAELAKGATKQSAYQASIGVQGHHNWETRVHHLVSSTRTHGASEVVAESWENQDLIDSCIDCVLSWRHSPGHWSAVSGTHKYYGYDIRKGSNGIWYGTGIFAQ